MKRNWQMIPTVLAAVLVSVLLLQPGYDTVSAQAETGSIQSQRTLNVRTQQSSLWAYKPKQSKPT